MAFPVYQFRAQAGLAPKAARYGGWESRDSGGHSLGHYLSALAHLHAACQAANGDGWFAGILGPLDPVRIQEMLRTEHGGMNEVLADLAEAAGDARYLAMAARFFRHEASPAGATG